MSDEIQYPLYEQARDRIQSITGKSIDEIQIADLAAGELQAEDLRIHADSLSAQASVARRAGYTRLGENLERAAELTRLPNEDLLRFYEALRPGRSTFAELESLAAKMLTDYDAPHCAALIREAAQVYQQRGLLRQTRS